MTRTLSTSLALAAIVAMTACSTGSAPTLGGRQQEQTQEQGPENTAAVTEALTESVSIAALLGAPFASEGIEDELSGMNIKKVVEQSVLEAYGLTDPGCLSYGWEDKTVTVTFEQCETVAYGVAIDGTVSMAVSTDPITVEFLFQDLDIEDGSFDGELSVSYADGVATFEAEMDVTTPSGNASAEISELTVEVSQAGIIASGVANVETDKYTGAVSFEQVWWLPGDCLPSSGSMSYLDDGFTVKVTFLDKTPDTGIVLVKIGKLPAVEMPLLDACPA